MSDFVHGYIPNSAQGIKQQMLKEIGVKDVAELYSEIPEELRFKKELNIPRDPASELEVVNHIESLLAKNKTTRDLLSFLGAGCWPHYVPGLCDEIVSRSEFMTAYAGSEYTDLGRYQTLFEFQSMIGDLVGLDVVGVPVYDGFSACGDAALMASKLTGRRKLLVPQTLSPDRLATMRVYCGPWLDIVAVEADPDTGQMSLKDLAGKISSDTAAVLVENPSYLGFIESQGEEVARTAHDHGALMVVYVNPVSLGVLRPPGEYGADVVCAEGQPLGVHMACGSGSLGILACRDDKQLVATMPSFLLSITRTVVEGERAFSWHVCWDEVWERIVYTSRDKAKSFTGTSTALWAIAATVYMALLGPRGMQKLGETNMQKAHYAMRALAQIEGVRVPVFRSTHFNEFTVNFDGTGKTVAEINAALLERGILGGKDLSREFPQLGNTALYCVTEVHKKEDIDRLAATLREVLH